MFALYGMSKIVLALVLVIGLISPIIQFYPLVVESNKLQASQFDANTALCVKYPPSDGSQRALLFVSLVGARASIVWLELTLLGLTWYKTFTRWGALRSVSHTPLTTMLLRDGTFYFCVISVVSALNLCGMIFYFYPASYLRDLDLHTVLFDMGTLVDTFTSIFMSRFIIGLRDASTSMCGSISTSKPSQTNTLRFASMETIVGNLGAELRDGTVDDDDEFLYESIFDTDEVAESTEPSSRYV